MNPICMSKHPDKTNTWCERVPDHDGPHRTVSGLAWGEVSDDMDGGVTAALIEEEADREDDVTLLRHDLALMEDRAVKAEQERDDCQHDARAAESALSRLRRALDLPDTTTPDDMIARIEEINAQPATRTLGPEDITDEMVLRFWNAFNGLNDGLEDMTLMTIDEVRLGLRAALTEPPARPEGAEELARLIADADVGEWDCGDLADALLATGRVRLATEEES